MKIHTQDNRNDWRLRKALYPWPSIIIVRRWRPSLLWRVMHRLGVA